jgi:hypothetical protein
MIFNTPTFAPRFKNSDDTTGIIIGALAIGLIGLSWWYIGRSGSKVLTAPTIAPINPSSTQINELLKK